MQSVTRSAWRYAAVIGAALIVGCGSGASPTVSTSPAISPTQTLPVLATESPTQRMTPSPRITPSIDPIASAVALGQAFFKPFGTFSVEAATTAEQQSLEKAVSASLAGAGSLGVAYTAHVVRGVEPAVTVFAFSLKPSGNATEMALFARVTGAMAKGFGGAWVNALDGQALGMASAQRTALIFPYGSIGDVTLFMLVTGAADAPVNEAALGLMAGT